ncbi:unnamed protein product [Musa acuminata var. zebrina]
MKLVWCPENAAKAYIDAVKALTDRDLEETNVAELVAAMAGGWRAQLIVEAWSRDAGAATGVGLRAAARHARGRHVCHAGAGGGGPYGGGLRAQGRGEGVEGGTAGAEGDGGGAQGSGQAAGRGCRGVRLGDEGGAVDAPADRQRRGGAACRRREGAELGRRPTTVGEALRSLHQGGACVPEEAVTSGSSLAALPPLESLSFYTVKRRPVKYPLMSISSFELFVSVTCHSIETL